MPIEVTPLLLLITTVFRSLGTYWLLLESEFAPKIYPKCALSVLFNSAPIKGKVTIVSPLQPLNTELPIEVTLSGITMLVSPLQL